MLFRNATLATMSDGRAYGLVRDGAIAVQDGDIVWLGPEKEVPGKFLELETHDLEGRLVTPGLVDCHTHLVHGGNRASEFEMRLEGATYEEVALAGGGIVSTMAATRQATVEDLVASALLRVDRLISEGVCTVEIKSGYGLDKETELNMLRAARAIETERPIRVRTSFLGAHAVPEAFSDDPDDYIDRVCIPALIAAHDEGLVDAVDGFCERIAFTPAQIERVFKVARDLRLPVKLHAEQLSHLGGTQLATRYNAISVDHLEYVTDKDARLMAAVGSVAVILPGAFYTLRETKVPPIEAFRDNGVAMAVATDCNPGSSPLTSLLLAMNMACTLFRMTPEEALFGVTRYAARALGLEGVGVLREGAVADLAIWDIEDPAELSYRIGFNPLYRRVFQGRYET